MKLVEYDLKNYVFYKIRNFFLNFVTNISQIDIITVRRPILFGVLKGLHFKTFDQIRLFRF